jgi:hypothetical protein
MKPNVGVQWGLCMRQNRFRRVEAHRNQESTFSTGVRPLFAILALLLYAIAARADKPIVIKDSEAIHYDGKRPRYAAE